MADKNNPMAGLFGMSPGMYRQQQDEANQIVAGRMASNPGTMMSPSLAPLYAQAQQQGTLIGRGIGGLFGVEDPMLKKAADVDAATKAVQAMDIDMKDPAQLYPAMIQELQKRGLVDLALPLVKEYQGILGSKAEAAYKMGAANRWEDDNYEYKQDYLGRVMVLDKKSGTPVGFYSAADFKQKVVPEGANAPTGAPSSSAKPTAKPKERRPITDAEER